MPSKSNEKIIIAKSIATAADDQQLNTSLQILMLLQCYENAMISQILELSYIGEIGKRKRPHPKSILKYFLCWLAQKTNSGRDLYTLRSQKGKSLLIGHPTPHPRKRAARLLQVPG